MRPKIFLLSLALLAAPAQVVAQSNSADEVDVGAKDDGNSKLGLLGLLGLAGLLGLKRREPDIHVDARRDRGNR